MAEKRIVRIMATDIDGSLPLIRALRRIKGMGFAFSRAVCMQSGIDSKKKVGLLEEGEIKKVEEIIRNPSVPAWLLNRRMDRDAGKGIHITGVDIGLKLREDINLLKRIRSYRGIRHEFGLPVRGQRTRSSFRTQKTVGVMKKVAIQRAKPATEKK